jgi:hypothetical protein
VKLAKEQHKVKSQNWGPILLKTAIEFCFFVPFNYFNNLDFTRLETILPEMDEGSIVLDYESPPGLH